ncbi:MAG: lipid A phosphoethanolamine transferase [Muribaculaceae bacterium]|nr:lipid A phosphoethanolamine transferase [Muribaculaceae bacterium]
MWFYPAVLLVANVALCFTESYTPAARAANVLLPGAVFLLLSSASRNVGRTILLCLPLSIYAAFQIVLLFLYGGSIIAIDMFLNVLTTNPGEAAELLENLGPAILTVVLLYLPPILWAVYLLIRHKRASLADVRTGRRVACVLGCTGLIAIAIAYATGPYNIRRQVFPLNVIDNTFEAVNRYHTTREYPGTSEAWSYGATSTRPDSLAEIYVLVVGETCRADNWQLLGYDRATNPGLSRRDDVIAFPRVLSESNTTHKSVPLLLSPLTSESFGDSIYEVRSIFEAFREAGFKTAFISNQQRNHSFIDFFGEQADTCHFISDTPGALRSDSVLVQLFRSFAEDNPGQKLFAVLHCYGSHFNYRDRYTDAHRVFRPDDNGAAKKSNRDELINAYDNTIVSTDAMLADLIENLDQLSDSALSALLFIPDHGEDIFDDSRGRFLHASPTPTYWQLHVPMLMWTSKTHRDAYPSLSAAARKNADKDIASSSSVFHTVLSLAGINTPYFNPGYAISSDEYRPHRRMYLNDYNEAVPLAASGMKQVDFDQLARKGISWE